MPAQISIDKRYVKPTTVVRQAPLRDSGSSRVQHAIGYAAFCSWLRIPRGIAAPWVAIRSSTKARISRSDKTQAVCLSNNAAR